jgi:3'(2'), 5'-bisphosphate nucleotidase
MPKFNITHINQIAAEAGSIIMGYRGQVEASFKDDRSPVTKADKEASDHIMSSLRALTPDIPVVSEEATLENNLEAMCSPQYWVTDPLDGTRSYLDGHDGFGVHIALFSDGTPVLGVAHFPAQEKTYFTDGNRAYLQVGAHSPEIIKANQQQDQPNLSVAVDWEEKQRPATINGLPYSAIPGVGGERICMVAAGDVDMAWMVPPTQYSYSIWDIAASHTILKAAGGELVDSDTGASIIYLTTHTTAPPCVGAHPDILRNTGLAQETEHENISFI